MRLVALKRARDGYQLERGKVETYLWTYASQVALIPGGEFPKLAEQIRLAYDRFTTEVDNIMEEVESYLTITHFG